MENVVLDSSISDGLVRFSDLSNPFLAEFDEMKKGLFRLRPLQAFNGRLSLGFLLSNEEVAQLKHFC